MDWIARTGCRGPIGCSDYLHFFYRGRPLPAEKQLASATETLRAGARTGRLLLLFTEELSRGGFDAVGDFVGGRLPAPPRKKRNAHAHAENASEAELGLLRRVLRYDISLYGALFPEFALGARKDVVR